MWDLPEIDAATVERHPAGALALQGDGLLVCDLLQLDRAIGDAADLDHDEALLRGMLEHDTFFRPLAGRTGRVEIAVAPRRPARPDPALVAVHFADAPVARWELATRKGEDVRLLRPGRLSGNAMDSSRAVIVDPTRVTLDAADLVGGFRTARFEEHPYVAALGEPPLGFVFPAGPDAIRPCWWGIGENGLAVRLVVDLGGVRVRWPEIPDLADFRDAHVRRTLAAIQAEVAARPDWAERLVGQGPLDRELGRVAARLRRLSEFGLELEPYTDRIAALRAVPRLRRSVAACLDAIARERG